MERTFSEKSKNNKRKDTGLCITRIIILVLFSTLFVNLAVAQRQEKFHRAKIFYSTIPQWQELTALGLDLDHGLHKKKVFIESDFSEHELQLAQKAGFATEITINDVQEYYLKQNSKNTITTLDKSLQNCQPNEYPTPAHFELGSMGGFFTYDEILAELDSMASLYPDLITTRAPISDFSTEEGRSIFWLKLSDNPNIDEDEQEILYDAVHHAREPASVSTLIFYMWYLLENYSTNPEVQSIVDNTELYFIPVVNPDGYVYNVTTHPNGGGLWRKNRRDNGNGSFGVDNNRNYGYQWGTTGISFDPNSQVYPGTAPFSEVENQAMKWFCENHNFGIALNNHSYSDLLLYPFGYQTNTPTPDHNLYQAISEEMVCENGYTNELAASLYPASGDSDDWMYVATAEKPKIFAFTPEIGSPSQGFWPASDEIIDLCNETMHMNLTAAHLVTNYVTIEENSATFYSNLNIEVPITVKRLGLQAADITVAIVPVSSNVVNVDAPITFTNVDVLDEASSSISIALDSNIQNGDFIDFNLVLNSGNYSLTKLISKVYGQEEIVFEQMDDLSNWEATSWGVTNTTYVTNPTAITDSPNTNYENNLNSSIETTDIDLSNAVAAELTFQAKWQIEADWDYVQLEVSNDNGTTWEPQCGKHTHAGGAHQELGEPLYDGEQLSWVGEKVSLNNYVGESIKIRVRLYTDGATVEDGFYFDDFTVKIIPIDCTSDNPIPCNDNNPNTINDVIQPDCSCQGSYYLELELKTFLQGPYDSISGLMQDNLRTLNTFPLIEPYTAIDENLVIGGNEATTTEVLSITGENAIVDWILVELRDGENPAHIIETQAALLQRDGDIVSAADGGETTLIFQDHSSDYNSVLVAIKHRNHFGIRILNPIPIQSEYQFISLDFSDPNVALYGGEYAMQNLGDIRLMISGDANRDGQVNAVDKNNYWREENGNPFIYLNTKADFNLDGAVNPVDKNGYWRINNSRIEQLE